MKQIETSVIVPLFNEETRSPPFLNDLLKIAKKEWEIILVDDGSKDKTLDVIKKYNFPNKKIITYSINKGKGYAVKKGVEAATGNYILFIDADGSIHPSQIENMILQLKKHDTVVGNRNHDESHKETTFFRSSIGKIFNLYARVLFNIPVNDNLCGFKGFKKEIAKSLFNNMLSERWVFDVELFYQIKKNKYSLYFLPIEWEHRDESKINSFEILKILYELLELRMKINKER
ncbi:MAG: hypothetical protein CMH62_02550 [Nanoarchaeota archaeon]|nr:hypothetical protein [Nanoarchaeota archaeon]|tara:strand:+ start:1183 stop:1878 length:696 start_codon:yes stop_codon:yes gene_type:complete